MEEYKIIDIVNTFKKKKSTDPFNIDMIIIKEIISYIVKPFAYIFNLSFSMGIFPQEMKTAKVVPIYKAGNKYMFNNYRPISLLPQF